MTDDRHFDIEEWVTNRLIEKIVLGSPGVGQPLGLLRFAREFNGPAQGLARVRSEPKAIVTFPRDRNRKARRAQR